MLGTVIVKPIEATLSHDVGTFGTMDPYCVLVVGKNKGKGQVCKKGGTNPFWEDAISVPTTTNEMFAYVEVKDRDHLRPDELIGVAEIDLEEVASHGNNMQKWYDVFYKKRDVGQILIDVSLLEGEYHKQHVIYSEKENVEKIDKEFKVTTISPDHLQSHYQQNIKPTSNEILVNAQSVVYTPDSMVVRDANQNIVNNSQNISGAPQTLSHL